MLKWIFGMTILHLLTACSFYPQSRDIPIHLGHQVVKIVHEDYGPGQVFVHLHANEVTALQAARKVARQQGGHLIRLQHKKTRDIAFNYRGRHYEFDPNRIYTHQGVVRTLQQHHCYHHEVVPIIERFGKIILKHIVTEKVVAVHNNQDYSLLDYLPKHPLEKDASQICLQKQVYHRNFFMVTRLNDFKHYCSLGYNVVLQSPAALNDGSLSVALKDRHYINVEAGFYQLLPQIRMLQNI